MSVKLEKFSNPSILIFVMGVQNNCLQCDYTTCFHSYIRKLILEKWKKSSQQSVSTFVLGTRKNRLTEAILLSIHSMFSIINMKAKYQLLNLLCLKNGELLSYTNFNTCFGCSKEYSHGDDPQAPTPYVFMHKSH